ncbi:MAG TPA: hypothetical protein ENO01_00365 [Candidatus Marinimicrobia bacterium]|nr:hypothetical protein [Candidatus Neomarinimicrobiota bacterium]
MALQKREKILLSIAGAAVVIFVITQVLPKASEKSTPAPAPVTVRTETPRTVTPQAALPGSHTKLKSYSTSNNAWNLEWKNDPFVYSYVEPEVVDSLPEDIQRKIDAVEEEVIVHNFQLNGISWLNNKPTVLINDRILKPGDSIEGYTLSDVYKTYVILRKNKESIKVAFSEKPMSQWE